MLSNCLTLISVRLQLNKLQITYSYFTLQIYNVTLLSEVQAHTNAMQITTENIP